MNIIIPRPVRDLITGYFEIRGSAYEVTQSENNQAEQATCGTGDYRAPIQRPIEKITYAIGRIALAVLAASLVFELSLDLGISAAVGSIALSLPAVVIVAGSWLLYHGATAVVASFAASSFSTFGTGLASIAAGYAALELHDIVPLGLIDYSVLRSTAEALGAWGS